MLQLYTVFDTVNLFLMLIVLETFALSLFHHIPLKLLLFLFPDQISHIYLWKNLVRRGNCRAYDSHIILLFLEWHWFPGGRETGCENLPLFVDVYYLLLAAIPCILDSVYFSLSR